MEETGADLVHAQLFEASCVHNGHQEVAMISSTSSSSATLGRYSRWARDFSGLGALSSAVVSLVALAGGEPSVYGFVVAATLIGAALGAVTGAVSRWFVGGIGSCLPIGLLLLAGPAVGLVWGMATGGSAVYLWWCWNISDPFPMSLLLEAGWLAGVAAAIQFGWFWLPYVLGTVKRRSVLSLWILAALSAAAIGLLLRLPPF
jgi:hypothetical protein